MRRKHRILSILVCLSLLVSGFTLMPLAVEETGTENGEQTTIVQTEGEGAEGGEIQTQPEAEEEPAAEVAAPEGFDAAAAYEEIMALDSNAEKEAYLKDLSQAEQEAFVAYAENLARERAAQIKTVPFTDAAPFLPAVDVTPKRTVKSKSKVAQPLMLMADMVVMRAMGDSEPEFEDNDGVVTSKTVENGLIRLEAYVTGATTTTTTETTTPVDIVLVLDQSGSMTDSFGNTSRQAAMKAAANNFIDGVAAEYDAEDSDHRMAIVTYGSNASNLRGWTEVNSAGATSLHGGINELPASPSGATNVGAGMSNAAALMGSGYNYNGTNTNRQKVVIVFTDGVPTTGSRFSPSVADTALGHANTLKNSGATVYTIGIFNGANVNKLHGDSGFDENSNGAVGSHWSSYEGIIVGDIAATDVPAGNRFLNYLSSNFLGVTNIGLEEYEDKFLFWGQAGWEITANATRTTTGYYLTAANLNALNEIFTTISENIQTGGATISLDATTVVKDIISPQFQLPEGSDVSDITVKTADCNSFNGDNPVWTNEQVVNLTPTVSGNDVAVTGFDFSENWVGKDTNTGEVHAGKKLIIEIPIERKEGFLGGNGVQTNGTDSGIYSGETCVENFERPDEDVEIGAVTVSAGDKNVYLLDTLSAAELKSGMTAYVGDIELDLSPEAVNYGLEPWQTEYVSINVELKDEENNDVSVDGITGTDGNGLDADTTYTATVTVTPKSAGTVTAKSGNGTGDINVFKPELTFKDSNVYYGDVEPAQASYEGNLVGTAWKHGATADTEVVMIGTAPELTKTYIVGTGVVGNKIATKNDIPVSVLVEIGGINVTDDTTFVHQDCEGVTGTENLQGGKFLLHVKTCSLTITKTGGASGEPYVFTIKKDDENYTEASITGNGSVTIGELPIGAYTISEDEAWSWRYGATYGSNATLNSGSPTGTITCNNAANGKTSWLNGYSPVVVNTYGITEKRR